MGWRDSNPRSQSQNLKSYRWTTPQHYFTPSRHIPPATCGIRIALLRHLTCLVGPVGFEPTTVALRERCYYQLSYGPNDSL